MAEGAEVVKRTITEQFGSAQVQQQHNSNTKGTVLYFSSGGRSFSVEVTHEFDDDYQSGQVKVDLRSLGKVLRESKNGKAVVSRTGVLVAA